MFFCLFVNALTIFKIYFQFIYFKKTWRFETIVFKNLSLNKNFNKEIKLYLLFKLSVCICLCWCPNDIPLYLLFVLLYFDKLCLFIYLLIFAVNICLHFYLCFILMLFRELFRNFRFIYLYTISSKHCLTFLSYY